MFRVSLKSLDDLNVLYSVTPQEHALTWCLNNPCLSLAAEMPSTCHDVTRMGVVGHLDDATFAFYLWHSKHLWTRASTQAKET